MALVSCCSHESDNLCWLDCRMTNRNSVNTLHVFIFSFFSLSLSIRRWLVPFSIWTRTERTGLFLETRNRWIISRHPPTCWIRRRIFHLAYLWIFLQAHHHRHRHHCRHPWMEIELQRQILFHLAPVSRANIVGSALPPTRMIILLAGCHPAAVGAQRNGFIKNVFNAGSTRSSRDPVEVGRHSALCCTEREIADHDLLISS